jgi:hypothetical protein
VCLESLMAAIELELHSESARRAFEQAKAQNIELQRYSSLVDLLAVLVARDPESQLEKNRLLRVLLALARLGSMPLLWKSVLLYVFLPSLCLVRHRYKAPELSAEDLDGALWNVFFEVVASYPLDRRSVAAGLVLDTRKHFRRHVQDQEEKRRTYEEFLRAFEQLPPEIRTSASIAETGPLMQLDDMDRYEMRAVMRQCPGLSEEDADLIWETDVCGVRLLDYLRAREGADQDAESLERKHARLRSRKTRAKKPLYDFVQKNLRAACHISGSERLISG